MKKQRMEQEDGRYLIFYDTTEEEIEGSTRPLGKLTAAMPESANHLRWDTTRCEWVTYALSVSSNFYLACADMILPA